MELQPGGGAGGTPGSAAFAARLPPMVSATASSDGFLLLYVEGPFLLPSFLTLSDKKLILYIVLPHGASRGIEPR